MEQRSTARTDSPESPIDPCWHQISCSKSCYRISRLGRARLRDIESITVHIRLRHGPTLRIELPDVEPDDPPDILWLTEDARRRHYECIRSPEPDCLTSRDVVYTEARVSGAAQSAP